MKILFIHNQYQFAGGEDVAVQLEAELLRERGHEVKVVLFDNKAIKPQSQLRTAVGSLYNKVSKMEIEREIGSFKPDVIHVHNIFFLASPSVFYAAASAGIPVILTLHNYRLICCNALLLRENKVCELCIRQKLPLQGIRNKCYHSSYLQSALVTGISALHKLAGTWKSRVHTYISLTEFGRQTFLNSSLELRPEQLTVVPNYVPDLGYNAGPRSDFFLFVGRISIEKGVLPLLQSFADLGDHQLILAGDGPDREWLEEQFKSCSNILFKGQLTKDEILKIMRQCRALVFPSIWYEGLPFTIIEAFSVGTPVLASKLGAMKYLIKDGYNGLHFEPNSASDLKNCILKFSGLHSGQAFYKNARRTFEKQFTAENHYKALINIYQKAIEDVKADGKSN